MFVGSFGLEEGVGDTQMMFRAESEKTLPIEVELLAPKFSQYTRPVRVVLT